jgi:gag-polyprotein putative aspartyl protease
MYVAKKKSIHASLLLHAGSKKAMKKALLDTGATENFIHPRVVKQLSLRTKKLSKPRKVKNVDGTLNQSCYDPQRGHVTSGRNGPGHTMSVQVMRLVIAQVISFKVSLPL